MDHKILLVVQCRMASTRFPRKAVASLLGQPLLLFLLDRLSRVTTPHTLVVACPNTSDDQAIRDLCTTHGYQCLLIPGDPTDVLARFHAVAQVYPEAKAFVRICADCPLLDASIIDGLIAHYRTADVDHAGIAAEYGDGLDCEIFSRSVLDQAMQYAVAPSDREHVTPWMHRQCRCATYPCPFDLSWLRLSVDTVADLAFLGTLLRRALDAGYGLDLSWRDLMVLCSHPDIKGQMARRQINQAYVAQVAAERGGEPMAWRQLRYGET